MSRWAEELRRVMLRDGLTQRAAAKRLGVSNAHVNDLLHDRRLPSPKLVVRAQIALGVHEQFFIADINERIREGISQEKKRVRHRT